MQELPDVFLRIELRTFRRQRDQGDVGRHDEPARQMPAGLIDEKRRVCARRDLSGDFGQVQVHGLRVASGHVEGCNLSVFGAVGGEDIILGGSLFRRRARTCVPRLAQRRVILFFWPMRASSANQTSMAAGFDALLAPDLVQARGKAFFKILDRALSLLVMTGTSRELTISHGAQFPAQCLLGDDDAEFLEDPLAEVDDPPAHDAMHGRGSGRSRVSRRARRGARRSGT